MLDLGSSISYVRKTSEKKLTILTLIHTQGGKKC